jgi:8-oxo-dGTP pyrophosphatase MutT (NUDIX family)
MDERSNKEDFIVGDTLLRIKSESDQEHWGVGCIILNKENKILCIERSDNHLWCSPGGTVDPGETVVDAVIREIKEEVGLDITRPKYLGMAFTQTEKNGEVIIWNSYCFICEEYTGEIKIQEREVSQYNWLGLYECLRLPIFRPFLHSLDMMMQFPEYFERLYRADIAKMTSLEQMTSIHNAGSNGGHGHYDGSGKWVYDKPNKKQTAPTMQMTGINRANNQITELRDSYIRYFKKVKDTKSIYTVQNGKFNFPSYKDAIKQSIATNEQEYFKKFKEQYILYSIFGK